MIKRGGIMIERLEATLDRYNYLENELTNKSKADSTVAVEIPVSYKSIAYRKLQQIDVGSRPFIIPDKAYDSEKGLLLELARPEMLTQYEFL